MWPHHSLLYNWQGPNSIDKSPLYFCSYPLYHIKKNLLTNGGKIVIMSSGISNYLSIYVLGTLSGTSDTILLAKSESTWELPVKECGIFFLVSRLSLWIICDSPNHTGHVQVISEKLLGESAAFVSSCQDTGTDCFPSSSGDTDQILVPKRWIM